MDTLTIEIEAEKVARGLTDDGDLFGKTMNCIAQGKPASDWCKSAIEALDFDGATLMVRLLAAYKTNEADCV